MIYNKGEKRVKRKYFILFLGVVLIGIGFLGYVMFGQTGEKKAISAIDLEQLEEDFNSKKYKPYIETFKTDENKVNDSSKKILFVGNSLICNHDLPAVFCNLLKEMKKESEVYVIAKGSASLSDFSNQKNDLGSTLHTVLEEERWDYVILQENTKNIVSKHIEKITMDAVKQLDKKIKKNGANTAFFMTWAPKNGVVRNHTNIGLEEVQKNISDNYHQLAKEVDGMLFSIGDVFVECMKRYPNIELWEVDQSHASKEGIYLAACVMYVSIFQQSLENCNYTDEIEKDIADTLKKLASELVLSKSK